MHACFDTCGHLPPSITPLATALLGSISTHADKMRSNPSSGIDNAVKPFWIDSSARCGEDVVLMNFFQV